MAWKIGWFVASVLLTWDEVSQTLIFQPTQQMKMEMPLLCHQSNKRKQKACRNQRKFFVPKPTFFLVCVCDGYNGKTICWEMQLHLILERTGWCTNRMSRQVWDLKWFQMDFWFKMNFDPKGISDLKRIFRRKDVTFLTFVILPLTWM